MFSFSVLQHFDPPAFEEAVDEIGRVLAARGPGSRPDGERLRAAEPAQPRARAAAAEPVRRVVSAALEELERSFSRVGEVSISPQGFLTLNAQGADLDLLPRRARAVVRTSEALRRLGAPARVADSVWVKVQKR